jgi:hypothetical protein
MERAGDEEAPPETPLATIATELGKKVSVPRSKDGWVFARIHLDYSWLGEVARVVYKPPPIYIRLLSRGMSLRYRLVPSTARNGLFVSRYILGPRDLLDVWNGKLAQNIDAISITTDDPAFFASEVSIELFEIPYPITVQRNWKVACGPEDEIIADAQHSIEVIQGEHLANLKQPILHDRSEPLVISGWAIDEQGEALAGNVFVKVDGTLTAPTDYERFRDDVAGFFENDAYTYSGWSANLDMEELPTGLHRITLRIISRDGRRCYEPKHGFNIYLHD